MAYKSAFEILREEKHRKLQDKLEDAKPKILRLLKKGVSEYRIAKETGIPPYLVGFVKWKNDFEKRGSTFEIKLYELARNKKYQRSDSPDKLTLNVTALMNALNCKTRIKVEKAIKDRDLEQVIEDQIKENLIGVVFSENYYLHIFETRGIAYQKLADDINTWPDLARKIACDLNVERYSKFAFENAQTYHLQPQQVGQLLIYSDECMFKDKYGSYNYIGLAKQTGLPLDKVVEILKHK
jgi:hypothetical protein